MRGQYKAYKSIEDKVANSNSSIEDNQEIESNITEHKPLSLYTSIRLVALIIISITLLSLSVNMINQPYEGNSYTNSTATTLKSISASDQINIALLGDSLIGVPWDKYDLKGKLTEQISSNVNLCSYGVGGSKIGDILKRVDSVLTECQPQYVILFWDSDCSDINESIMTSEQITELRNKYKDSVIEVCSRILKFGAGLAVAGPELLGEGYIMIGIPPRFYNKTGMLEAYKKMNQDVASSFSVPYIDVRQVFLDATKYNPLGLGLLTKDGEHPNNRGTQVIADLFSEQINDWTGFHEKKKRDKWSTMVFVYFVLVVIVLIVVLFVYSFRSYVSFRTSNDNKETEVGFLSSMISKVFVNTSTATKRDYVHLTD